MTHNITLEQARTAYKLAIADALQGSVKLLYDAQELTEHVRHDIELDSVDDLQDAISSLTYAISSLEKLRDAHPILKPELRQVTVEQMHEAMGQY